MTGENLKNYLENVYFETSDLSIEELENTVIKINFLMGICSESFQEIKEKYK